jgi:hypothetical protein
VKEAIKTILEKKVETAVKRNKAFEKHEGRLSFD